MASGSWEVGSRGDGDTLQTIELLCVRFERAWKGESPPQIESYLAELGDEDSRHHALCDLLWIEWDCRRQRGERPELMEYQQRFAAEAGVVDEAWRSDFRRLALEAQENQWRGGRYRIVQPHARGGLGQVYVAHDDELGRSVAIKEIQWRFAKKQGIQQRFIREAKITGRLEHPGIVPVYSVGQKPDGTPYYAMRFVDGESLKEAIDRWHGRLPPHSAATSAPAPIASKLAAKAVELDDAGTEASAAPDREAPPQSPAASPAKISRRRNAADYLTRDFRQLLSRFAYVCRVMEYAHRRGVLHRDLKPANIMLGPYGETLVVDWGLAKEIGAGEAVEISEPSVGSLTRMVFTTQGARVGTLAYMSPEQAAGEVEGLTPSCDVYSLGATLFHLLTGEPPLLGALGDLALERITSGRIPHARTIEPAIPAPLDAICARAMAHKISDRYPSAATLADDVEHWLADAPVAAYPEGLKARVSRWIRSHQTLVASGGIAAILVAISLAVVAGLTASHNHSLSLETQRANQEATTAHTARQEARTAQVAAESQRDQANSLADFLVEAFRSPSSAEHGSNLRVSEVLDRAFEQLKPDRSMPLATKIRLYESLMDANMGLGLNHRALTVATQACRDYGHAGDPISAPLPVRTLLAKAYAGDRQNAKAIDLWTSVVAETARIHGESAPQTVRNRISLSVTLSDAGRVRDALAITTELMHLVPPKYDLTDKLWFDVESQHAQCLALIGQHEEAIAIRERLVTVATNTLPKNDRLTATALSRLSAHYATAGKFQLALTIQKDVVRRWEQIAGPNGYNTLLEKLSLSVLYSNCLDYNTASSLTHQTLLAIQDHYGQDSTLLAFAQRHHFNCLYRAGNLSQALTFAQSTAAIRHRLFNPSHYLAIQGDSLLATALLKLGRTTEAISLLSKYDEDFTEALSDLHPHTESPLNAIAFALTSSGEFERAASLYTTIITAIEKETGPRDRIAIDTKISLAGVYFRAHKFQQSLDLLQGTEPIATEMLGPHHPLTLEIKSTIGQCLRNLGRAPEAIAIQTKTLEILRTALGPTHALTLQHQQLLGSSLIDSGRIQEGLTHYTAVARDLPHILGETHRDVVGLKINIGIAHYFINDYQLAIQELEALRPHLLSSISPHETPIANYFVVLSNCHAKQGHLDLAIALLQKALDDIDATARNATTTRAIIECRLAKCLNDIGRKQEAIQAALHACDVAGPEAIDPIAGEVFFLAGNLLKDSGNYADGTTYLTRACKAFHEYRSSLASNWLQACYDLATCERMTGNINDCTTILRPILASTANTPTDRSLRTKAVALYASCLRLQGNLECAEELLLEATSSIDRDKTSTNQPVLNELHLLYTDWGRRQDINDSPSAQ